MPLNLDRKKGQKFIIYGGELTSDIEVEVIHHSNRSTRLAITAPQSVTIDREEVYLRKLEENEIPES